jgi:hypothetical protein
MKSSHLTTAAVLIALGSLGCMAGIGTNLTTQQAPATQAKPKKSMLAFRSEQELDRYIRELGGKAEAQTQKHNNDGVGGSRGATTEARTRVC